MGEHLTEVTSNMFSPKLVFCVSVLFFIGMEAAPKPKPNPKPEPKPKPQGLFGGWYPNYDYEGGNRMPAAGWPPMGKYGGKYGNPPSWIPPIGKYGGKYGNPQDFWGNRANGTMQGKDLLMAYSTR